MQILALVTDCFGGYGGIAQYNRDLVSALSRHPGVDLVEILPRISPLAAGPVPEGVRQLSPIEARLPYSAAALMQMVRRRPELIFCGHLYHGPLAMMLGRLFGAKIVTQLHGTEIWHPIRPSLGRALLAADHILCVSEDTRARLLVQLPGAAPKVSVLYNTVRPRFYVGDRDAARELLGVGNAFVLLSVSRLAETGYKGQDRVIRAIPQLVSDGINIRYLIAGEGPDRARLQALADELGVSSSLTFLGNIPEMQLPDLYRASDLFVLPSTGEGFGIVYAEAMASGTPALGLDVGGVREALAGDALGFLTTAEEFEHALAAAIRQARVLNPSDRAALSARTLDRFGADRFESSLNLSLKPLL